MRLSRSPGPTPGTPLSATRQSTRGQRSTELEDRYFGRISRAERGLFFRNRDHIDGAGSRGPASRVRGRLEAGIGETPAGNSLIFIALDEPEITYDEEPEPGRSRLARALDTAVWRRDLKGHDDVKAARVHDIALARAEPIERARALAARTELAVALGEAERALALRAELKQIPLSDEEHERFRDELHAAGALERLMS